MVRAGEVLVIPSDVPHEAVALEDTLDVDVFSPPREDWLKGTDAYLGDRRQATGDRRQVARLLLGVALLRSR